MTRLQPLDSSGNPSGLLPGFSDIGPDSQRVFRVLLDAMARPGTLHDLPVALAPPAPLSSAAAAVALTMADFETPVWLDCAEPACAAYLRFQCGCPLTPSPATAAFALITAPSRMPPLEAFGQGSDDYPDRSTTLIIELPDLTGGTSWTLHGPGIESSVIFSPQGLPADFAAWFDANHRQFPCGVDLIFTSGGRLACLPRSSRCSRRGEG
jgi:alpha-D-ribose 1-methylphosphonate 5-triphosphate synthase subunit PhnH